MECQRHNLRSCTSDKSACFDPTIKKFCYKLDDHYVEESKYWSITNIRFPNSHVVDSSQNGGQNTGIGRYWLNNGDSGLSASQNVENTMTNAAQGLVNGDYRQSFVYNQNGDQNQQTVDHKNLNINIPTTTQRQHFNKPNINRDQNSPTTKSTKVLNR